MLTPRYPVWIVHFDGHYRVLFAVRKALVSDWKVERNFDLYYYDGFSNQTRSIMLTIGKCWQ